MAKIVKNINFLFTFSAGESYCCYFDLLVKISIYIQKDSPCQRKQENDVIMKCRGRCSINFPAKYATIEWLRGDGVQTIGPNQEK